jgi:hypothetical protein
MKTRPCEGRALQDRALEASMPVRCPPRLVDVANVTRDGFATRGIKSQCAGAGYGFSAPCTLV